MRHALLLCSSAGLAAAFTILFACGSDSGGDTPGNDGGDTDGTTPPGVTPPGGEGGPGDGGTTGDGNTAPFCASLSPPPKLCEDFDDGAQPAASTTQTGAGSTLAIDSTLAKSQPSSYKVTVPTSAGQITYGLLATPLTYSPAATTFTVAFSFYAPDAPFVSGPTNVRTLVIARAFVGQNSAHGVAIELASENGPDLREQEGVAGQPPTLDHHSDPPMALPKAGTWVRYELTFNLTGTKTATLKVDGVQVSTLALTGVNYDTFALNIGLQSDAAYTAYYDDVVMDWK